MATLGERVRKGLRLFIALVVVTMVILLIFTARKETIDALRRVNAFYLIFAFIFWFLYNSLETIRISLFVHGVTGRWGKITMGYKVILTGAFLAAVTPFQTGGFPVQLYIMDKEGISFGRGTLVLLLRWVFSGILIVTLLPFLLPILSKQSSVTSIRILSKYSLVIYIVIIVFIAFILIRPSVLKRFLYRISLRGGKRTIMTKWIYVGFREIEEMRKGFWNFTITKKWHSIVSYFLTFFTYLPYFLIAPFLLKGLGVEMSFLKATFLPVVVILLTFFAPTPGGTGISEGGFAILFSPFVARHLLGVFTILWRFFTCYLTAIIGGFATL
ncbi:MAG: flippase-like domain-containing protein, partial [Spirochaetales bacterium]|nr:flippase-like domain-containing protein [Spirochaetales bacterium]